ncbi:kinase-like protein [Backusella circina FSU 941]|nr:kinase-like protein [Backusella circina FSU 941]
MYNQPSPVEIVPRRASTQLYLSKSSETTDGWVKFEEPKATGSFLKVTNGPRLAEKQPPKKESVQNLKKSGSSDMMLSVETVTPKSSKSTPLVTEATENNNGYKINQAACRRASLKQMGTNPVIVKDDNSQETVYALGKSIGKGQFGEVFGGLNMSTGEYVAIKRIRRNDMDCDDMNEVDFLKYLDSEHIVRYKGYSKDREFLNIVLEYVEMGSLRTNIKCFGKFPENLAASHTYKILSGLKYLHDKLVIHCDLKAANILITKTGCLKLTDFGVSLFSKMKDDDTGEPSGTPNWMAPEVIKFNRPTEKSDIWSLGCTVVEMLTGKPPYSNMVSFAVLFKIVEDDTLPIPENISEV